MRERPEKATQEEIDEWVVEAEMRRARGEQLTDYEWLLVQYALPPTCHACGYAHGNRKEGRDE